MSNNSISEFIEIIKEDINILIKNIQEKESSFDYFISERNELYKFQTESKKFNHLLTIEFRYFFFLGH